MPLPVLGGNRHGFAQPGFPGFQGARLGGARFGFIGGKHDRLAGLADDVGEGPVVGQQAGTGIHQEYR